jgi:polysaccharide deacetylase 2 family uncharacterized protein YibQ
MMSAEFPIRKSDIHYDPTSQEVTLKREKFDALVSFAQDLLKQLEAVEDARDVQRYRGRKAQSTADVLQALTEDVLEGTAAVRDWLESPGHTISELSERTGIPYATCHRIVNERLGTPDVEIGQLKKFIAVASKGHSRDRTRAVGRKALEEKNRREDEIQMKPPAKASEG